MTDPLRYWLFRESFFPHLLQKRLAELEFCVLTPGEGLAFWGMAEQVLVFFRKEIIF